MPGLYIISGCNGSGKTTSSYSLLPELLECRQYVNSDEFAKSLSPYNPSAASLKAGRFMLMKIKYLMDSGQTFGIETTLATRTLTKLVSRAQAKGYEVTVLYFWLSSPQMAIERVRKRVASGGHNIPEEVIRRRYHLGLKYFFHLYQSEVDYWMLVNNSSSPREVIATGGKDKEQYVTNIEEYQKIQEYVGARK